MVTFDLYDTIYCHNAPIDVVRLLTMPNNNSEKTQMTVSGEHVKTRHAQVLITDSSLQSIEKQAHWNTQEESTHETSAAPQFRQWCISLAIVLFAAIIAYLIGRTFK